MATNRPPVFTSRESMETVEICRVLISAQLVVSARMMWVRLSMLLSQTAGRILPVNLCANGIRWDAHQNDQVADDFGEYRCSYQRSPLRNSRSFQPDIHQELGVIGRSPSYKGGIGFRECVPKLSRDGPGSGFTCQSVTFYPVSYTHLTLPTIYSV